MRTGSASSARAAAPGGQTVGMGPGDAPSGRLMWVDVLRGLAILAVLAIHIPHYAPGGWREHPFFFPAFVFDFGYLGVPLFVLISGFCIHRRAAMNMVATGEYGFRWGRFWRRRFWRLYPPYVAAMVFSVGCALLLTRTWPQDHASLYWDVLTHLLLIHNLTPEFATSLGNGAFWSLGMEEQLYGLYALLLLLISCGSRRTALALVASVTIVWRLAAQQLHGAEVNLGPFHLGQWFMWPLQYWLYWTLGAIAVDAHVGRGTLPRWCRSWWPGCLLVGAGLTVNQRTVSLLQGTSFNWLIPDAVPASMLMTLDSLGEVAVVLGFFCWLNAGLQREVAGGMQGEGLRVLARLGQVSYSVYLTHVPVIHVLDQKITLGHGPMEWLLRYALYLPAILLVGVLFFQGIERRFLPGTGGPATAGGTAVRQSSDQEMKPAKRRALVAEQPGVYATC
ncbi:MAG: acyltransferase family protein [Maioricimonas sp. JB049]